MKNTLAQAMRTTFESLISNYHTHQPGRVESYEYEVQRATVKPLIKKKYKNDTVESMPVLVNVPVMFPRTSLGGITFPISKGDGVLLLFAERSLERWYSSGDEVEPGDPRKFDLSDAVCIPGLYSFADNNIARNNEDVEIQNKGQFITIKKNGDIEIGSSSLVKLVTEAMFIKFNSHTHLYAPGTSPPAVSGTPVDGSSVPIVLGSAEATTKVKAQ